MAKTGYFKNLHSKLTKEGAAAAPPASAPPSTPPSEPPQENPTQQPAVSARIITNYFTSAPRKKKKKKSTLNKSEHRPFNNRHEMEHFLSNGKYAIMTGHKKDVYSPEESERSHQNLIADLEQENLNYTPVQGRWEGNEAKPSVMIHDIDHEKAQELARKYHQDAHIYSHEGKHSLIDNLKGQHTHGTGHHVDNNLFDNYSEISMPNGEKHKFQLNVGYGTEVKKAEQYFTSLMKGKNAKEQKKKAFGSKSNLPPAHPKREKQINQLKTLAQKRYGLEVKPSGGKIDAKTGKRRDKDAEVGVDKPDWRSGQLESQWSPDAVGHELAHLDLMPQGVGLQQGQELMDQQFKDVQRDYGYMQQKRSQHEIQPMSVENYLRRRAGIPAVRRETAIPKDGSQRMSVDTNQPAAVRDQSKNKDLLASTRLASPESKERVDMIDRGELVYNKDTGWKRGTSVDSKINQRARAASQDASRKDASTLMRSDYFRNTLEKAKVDQGLAPDQKHAQRQARQQPSGKVTGTNEGYSPKGVNKPVAQMRRVSDLRSYIKQAKPKLPVIKGEFGTVKQPPAAPKQGHGKVTVIDKTPKKQGFGTVKVKDTAPKPMTFPKVTKSVFADDHIIAGIQMPQELFEHHTKGIAVPYDHPHREIAAKFVADVWKKNRAEGERISEKLLGIGGEQGNKP